MKRLEVSMLTHTVKQKLAQIVSYAQSGHCVIKYAHTKNKYIWVVIS